MYLPATVKSQTAKLPSAECSLSRVSSFLSWSLFKPIQPEPDWSGVFSLFLEKSFRLGFRTMLFGQGSVDSVIDLTAISTLGITTLSLPVKIASWIRFLTAVTALLTSFLTCFWPKFYH